MLNGRVEKFLLSCGIDKDKIVWLPNGVDSDLFHPGKSVEKNLLRKKYQIPVQSIVVLFVGRFVHKKGYQKVVQVSSNEYHLVFAGGTSSRNKSKQQTFLGRLDQRQLAEVYRLADIFILPSEGEGFPLSVQEAMASGLAIVMSNDEGYGLYKLDPKQVALLNNPSIDNIKTLLTRLCKDSLAVKRMSEYSSSYANKSFSWPIIVKQLESIYAELQGSIK